ncbi:MAG: LysM peptidoglycan-binding domain-containing protein [Candidatus Riflebacteria bacterium]|nr:LysM peptidoglycan-binding domain-containing protein [Candidatus Riflebacteria bacterium]
MLGAEKKFVACLSLVVVFSIFIGIPAWAMKVHIMVAGDTLWELSQLYYGEPTLYQVFLKVNRITNPRTIPIGTRIKVPGFDQMKKLAAMVDPKEIDDYISKLNGEQASQDTSGNTSGSGNSGNTSQGSSSMKQVDRSGMSFRKVLEGPETSASLATVSSFIKE